MAFIASKSVNFTFYGKVVVFLKKNGKKFGRKDFITIFAPDTSFMFNTKNTIL